MRLVWLPLLVALAAAPIGVNAEPEGELEIEACTTPPTTARAVAPTVRSIVKTRVARPSPIADTPLIVWVQALLRLLEPPPDTPA